MKNWILFIAALASCADAAQLDCDAPVTPISEVQGNGAQSPMIKQLVTVKGVVTGDFRGKDALEGFFIQELVSDNNPQTSDGIFIHHKDTLQKLNKGDVVVVNGRVSEQFDVTQVSQVAAVKVCEHGHALPQPYSIELPLDKNQLEQFEGMLLNFKRPVVVTDFYQYMKYGEFTVSSELLLNPTARFRPGEQVAQQLKADHSNRLIINDGSNLEYPTPELLTQRHPLTLGQAVHVTGVMHYAYGKYKIEPIEKVKFLDVIDHTKPSSTGGTLKIANFNLKNFFTTLDPGSDQCGPKNTFSCRGADTEDEFHRQINKLVAAINLADADVMTLQELENNQNSVKRLVNALNKAAAYAKWTFIETGVLGNDVIKVGMIYQADKVKTIGKLALLNQAANPEFDETKHRTVVAQTFISANNNKFNVVAAHFKSKSCQDAKGQNLDQQDGQGCYNVARKQAATLVANWLHTDPTGQQAEYTILGGDLNSYQKEDPIVILQSQGFGNLAEKYLTEKNWTASYRGYVGSLDYILTNPEASKKATGLTQWHINSIQSPWYDYNIEWIKPDEQKPSHFYSPTPVASSDHDIVIAGFDL